MTIPACHACGSSALPFDVRLDGSCWRHACGAIVCPACGGASTGGNALCDECRVLIRALPMQPADVVRVARGRPRHAGR